MTSKQYQDLAKQSFAKGGSEINDIHSKYDYGVHFIAAKEQRRIAVFVRFLNERDELTYQTVMLLFAGSQYYNCTGAALITNKKVSDAVKDMASKLGVRIYEEWPTHA
jgi:HJR/Mrr/RecB family endonuclease